MKIKAFTLAEVLITLAIIGIVAAVTIPSVIANYQQSEFKTGLRKAVSVLNEAIQANIAIEGETPYENTDLFSYIQKHMNVIKSIPVVYGCINNDNTPYDVANSGLDHCRGGNGSSLALNRIFYTTDGFRFEMGTQPKLHLHESEETARNSRRYTPYPGGIAYSPKDGQCGSYGLNQNIHNTNMTPCVITVDVNGDKKPNSLIYTSNAHGVSAFDAFGYAYKYSNVNDKRITDVFNILITEDRAIPFGVVAQRAMYEK